MTVYFLWVTADNSRPSSPSEAIVDSQSVAASPMVHSLVGYDNAKHVKGRKRHQVSSWAQQALKVMSPASPEAKAANQSELLNAGQTALKQKRYPEAVQSLEAFCDCADTSSKDYLQAQMGLIKAYQRTDWLEEAIALGFVFPSLF